MNVLVCGSRDYTNGEKIVEELDKVWSDWYQSRAYDPITGDNRENRGEVFVVIEGGARGADSIARDWAAKRDFPFQTYQANWKKFGKSAGSIRNKAMLLQGRPELVLAFFSSSSLSPGTSHMVKQAKAAGIPVKEFIG